MGIDGLDNLKDDEVSVYLEGACGHEFEWPMRKGVPPPAGKCAEHGLIALWAERSSPSYQNLPRGILIDA